jgi:flagellar FliL protein
MADENENREVEKEEERVEEKRFPMKPLVLAVLMLFLVGGSFMAWKKGAFNSFLGDGKEEALASKSDEIEQRPDIGPMYVLNTFIVNLNEPQGKRYLKAKLELELENQEVQAEIDKRLPQFRDAILTMLSSKTYADINDLSGKFQLRAEIISMLNGYLHTGKISNVYFTEFIVQ